MIILLATSNPHKLEEILAVWNSLRTQTPDAPSIELTTLDIITGKNRGGKGEPISEPIEDQLTFEGNAKLKACYYANATDTITIADDSGLEVDALNGEPGVRSARYAGVTGPRHRVDQANNERLLAHLQHIPANRRKARFVCAMALAKPGKNTQSIITVRGTIEGEIIGDGEAPRGENGFGYDPLFIVSELGKTTAELSPQEKNAISHRGRAARLMWQRIETLGPDPAVW